MKQSVSNSTKTTNFINKSWFPNSIFVTGNHFQEDPIDF